jgi:hypothetical protein
MTTTHTPAPISADHQSTTRGQRVQLGDYTTDTGTHRILIGQRIDGIVHLYDEPDTDQEPTYLIEQGLTTNGELHALIDDYLAKAAKLGYAPMHGWF